MGSAVGTSMPLAAVVAVAVAVAVCLRKPLVILGLDPRIQ